VTHLKCRNLLKCLYQARRMSGHMYMRVMDINVASYTSVLLDLELLVLRYEVLNDKEPRFNNLNVHTCIKIIFMFKLFQLPSIRNTIVILNLIKFLLGINRRSWQGVFNTTLCDKIAIGRWFSLGTPFSSTDKTRYI
jgi:hypothetical protein